ncbi:hypothetical protein EKO23_05875 [Nocardioides guangzhouensis]|uniref:Uncharacterized protein n=1 Tax=Nocardioides guangzhouensis TaxID=2497878 RepID=A0A4Q4ZJA9_9ACTN|nr:hypothetical protein [Nocardioides guangzhouensis]RYP87561.1 hypothetical protein EKO23_05875 [Nocardioides guangzhouensis]
MVVATVHLRLVQVVTWALALRSSAASARPGRTRNFRTLVDEVSTKVFDRLPDETWFYPGRDNDSALGAERPQLPEWRERGW